MNISMYTTYLGFSETDFLSDPHFQDWVLNSTPENAAFWTGFLRTHPHKQQAVLNASNILKQLRFKEEFPDDQYIQQQYQLHLAAIEKLKQAPVINVTAWRLKKVWAVAAAFVAVMLVMAALYFSAQRQKNDTSQQFTVSTTYGQVKKIMLPDSTIIVLNGNSSLRYNNVWKANEAREVWLSGEAFFNVKHLNKTKADVKPGERFLVHASDVLVEVLGTEFDIRRRRGKTEVVLQKGSIKVTTAGNNKTQLIMQPGQIFTYTKNAPTKLDTIEAPSYTAWKEGKLMLIDPTLQEIANYLEDNYGKKIYIKDTGLSQRKIEGPIMLNNLDDALFIISTVLNTNVVTSGNTITIEAK